MVPWHAQITLTMVANDETLPSFCKKVTTKARGVSPSHLAVMSINECGCVQIETKWLVWEKNFPITELQMVGGL